MEGEKMGTNNSFGWIYSEEDQRNGVVAGWQDPTKTEILEQRQAGLSHSLMVSGRGGVWVGWGGGRGPAGSSGTDLARPCKQLPSFFAHKKPYYFSAYKNNIYSLGDKKCQHAGKYQERIRNPLKCHP